MATNKYKKAVLIEADYGNYGRVMATKDDLGIKSRLQDLTDEEAEKIAHVMELDVVFEDAITVGDLRQRITKLDAPKARVVLFHLVEQTFKGRVSKVVLNEAIRDGEGYHN